MPGSYQAVYDGTKAFLDSFSYALREELTTQKFSHEGVNGAKVMMGSAYPKAQMPLTRQVRRSARARDGEIIVRSGADQRDQLRDRLCRHRRMHSQDDGRGCPNDDRVDVLDRVVGHLRIEACIDPDGGAGDEQRIFCFISSVPTARAVSR
jgi:hypothetical protein